MDKEKPGFKYIVRVMNTDLDGGKKTISALRKIKGVNYAIANAACTLSGIDMSKKIGELGESDVSKLNATLSDTVKLLPSWMLNRRKDTETGDDKHLFASDIDFTKDMDLRIMKRIKSYRGVRHSFGLPVRGQRTKSNFRRNKGKGLGVVKSKQQPQKSDKGGDKK
ncbi:30S ribosomal protein S13 [Candidatus Woesearchaeota archaeon]|nr:30S ribosomal protein S13 [Candidatus Woesearchaeota archaeon]